MKCSFYWQPHLALENVQWKTGRPCLNYRVSLKSFPSKKKKKERKKKKHFHQDPLFYTTSATGYKLIKTAYIKKAIINWTYFPVSQVACPFLKCLSIPNFFETKKERLYEKKTKTKRKKKTNPESPTGAERHALPSRSSEM